MLFTTLFSAVGLLAASATAAPVTSTKKQSDPMPPFQVTTISMSEVTTGNTSINFTVHDPSHYGKATATCSGSWSTANGGYPATDYVPCGDSDFGWVMNSYTNASNFQLGIQHSYKDPDMGPAPYNWVDNYAIGNVTEVNLSCKAKKHKTVCSQKSAMIEAPVYYSAA